MIINQEGMRYTYNGMTYTVGAAVMATEASEYRGLYGTITEIRDGSDRETENDTPDIYCCFEPPLFQEEIQELEQRFTKLYQSPKKLDEITLDMVIMASFLTLFVEVKYFWRMVWNSLTACTHTAFSSAENGMGS